MSVFVFGLEDSETWRLSHLWQSHHHGSASLRDGLHVEWEVQSWLLLHWLFCFQTTTRILCIVFVALYLFLTHGWSCTIKGLPILSLNWKSPSPSYPQRGRLSLGFAVTVTLVQPVASCVFHNFSRLTKHRDLLLVYTTKYLLQLNIKEEETKRL